MEMRSILTVLLAAVLCLPAGAQEDEGYLDEEEASAAGYPTSGGTSLSGTGITTGAGDTAPTAPLDSKTVTRYAGQIVAGGDPAAATPCFDPMPRNVTLRGRGRLICWVAHIKIEPEEGASAAEGKAGGGSRESGTRRSGSASVSVGGDAAAAAGSAPAGYILKNVHQWSDGAFARGEWLENAKRVFPVAAQKFADETGDTGILKQRVTGYRAKVLKYMNPGMGAYMDNHEPAPVPDEVHWTILISGGYEWEFDHGNTRDCIFSGNGVAYLHGNGHSITTVANGDALYKGKPICIRCPLNKS
jgi:hypothetical protein